MTNKLTVRTAALGKELMAEAETRILEGKRHEVRMEFDYVLLRLETHLRERARVEELIDFFERKKKALETGKFDINDRAQLVMNDPELQAEMQNAGNQPQNIRR